MEGKGVKKWIPIGVDDFKEVRNEGYYFVDKSELISDILSERNKVYLFTRPRRFGKSLNLSM
ncbi:MAG: AAA family ATPase, partial [Candidatus Methanomethylophilaceae archaeon]